MHNCIFSGHCTQMMCDKSCPTLVESSYLLERNGISMSSEVFHKGPDAAAECCKILDEAEGNIVTVVSKSSTVAAADMLTYCSICQNWKGSRLHCTVYNLKYSQYLDAIKKSWSTNGESEKLEYMRIWAESAKVLIISNLDYINFKDFECQNLLTLLQSRDSNELTTIVVAPPLGQLVGNSLFFHRLISTLGGKAVKIEL